MKRLWIMIAVSMVSATALSQQPPFATLSNILDGDSVEDTVQSGKCGTPMIFEAIRRMREFPQSVQASMRAILQRPSTQASRLSPSGRFRIHFDSTGVNEARMISGNPLVPVPNSHNEYVDSVAAILDHCWVVEVDELGYVQPPYDGGNGGGSEYDVYIQSLSPDLFGFTSWEGETQFEFGIHERYATFITIDNDFLQHRTNGLDGLRVTCAHEFHHSIQIGSYGLWQTTPSSDQYVDLYFYELTAVWLEDVLYDDVNDYYFDVPRFLRNFKDASGRSLPFVTYSSTNAGYERAIWAHYLEGKYGREIMREIWEGTKSEKALKSMEDALKAHGSNLSNAFAEFSRWNVFTGPRADSLNYYPEGSAFPTLLPNTSVAFNGASAVIQGDAFPLSAQYYAFGLSADTVLACVTNTNYQKAYSDPTGLYSFRLVLSSSAIQGTHQTLTNGLTMGFAGEPADDWRTLYFGTGLATNLNVNHVPYPNPLRVHIAGELTLPAEDSQPGQATVYLLTSSLDLVYSGPVTVANSFGKMVATIQTRDLAPKVSSGVHFVVLRTEEKEYTWKLVIVQ